mmetsp:Transcript_28660/g.83023  ORF Transcript_28660/g.83023 Transcript_28660/m.83023 type:complete len:103 (-) Transcript_28660:36-344(-)
MLHASSYNCHVKGPREGIKEDIEGLFVEEKNEEEKFKILVHSSQASSTIKNVERRRAFPPLLVQQGAQTYRDVKEGYPREDPRASLVYYSEQWYKISSVITR